jgi:catechol-2,3-dioxygenase
MCRSRDRLGLEVISPDLGRPVFLGVGDDRAGVPHQIVLAPRPAGARPPSGRAAGNVHHIGLEVPRDIFEDERQRLLGLGLGIAHGTGDHPFLPVAAIYVDDPDGNEIELVARK